MLTTNTFYNNILSNDDFGKEGNGKNYQERYDGNGGRKLYAVSVP